MLSEVEIEMMRKISRTRKGLRIPNNKGHNAVIATGLEDAKMIEIRFENEAKFLRLNLTPKGKGILDVSLPKFSFWKKKTHLWEIDHPYYCSDCNYYSNDCTLTYSSWAEWLEQNESMDVDMNLIFRFDWDDPSTIESNGDEVWWSPEDKGLLRFYIIGQRKGLFRVDIITGMTSADEESVKKYLVRHMQTLKANWAPMM